MLEPMLMKFNTLMVLLMFHEPKMEQLLPNLVADRIDMFDPIVKNSKTDMAEPSLANERKLALLPQCT
jgi:hypothetical protein